LLVLAETTIVDTLVYPVTDIRLAELVVTAGTEAGEVELAELVVADAVEHGLVKTLVLVPFAQPQHLNVEVTSTSQLEVVLEVHVVLELDRTLLEDVELTCGTVVVVVDPKMGAVEIVAFVVTAG